MAIPIVIPVPERFWLFVDRRGDAECWPWTGTCNGSGHGHFCAAGETFVASRVAWFLANGQQPDGVVRHSCDNPPCCNPAHLSLGTHHDNMLDIRRRKAAETHCRNGHEWAAQAVRYSRSGTRQCPACNLAAVRKYQAAKGRPPRRKVTA